MGTVGKRADELKSGDVVVTPDGYQFTVRSAERYTSTAVRVQFVNENTDDDVDFHNNDDMFDVLN